MATLEEEPNTLDAPWLRRQVETHLIFGFLAHRLPFGWVFGAGFALAALVLLYQGAVLQALMVAFPIPLCCPRFVKMSRYHQAALGWWITKAILALFSFLFLLGSLVNFFRGEPGAIDLMLLGFIWFPGIEFAPSLVSRQRYLTIARLLLSVVILFLGIRAGRWT
jgi:hypothetical protein